MRGIFFAVVAVLLATAISYSRLGSSFDNQVTIPTLFQLRNSFKPLATIDPRIKIYAFDNSTFQRNGSADFSLEQWIAIFENLDKQSPRMILIDKYFGAFRSQDNLQNLRKRMDRLSVPVVVGSFVTEKENVDKDIVRRAASLARNQTVVSGFDHLTQTSEILVGPHPALQGFFSQLGHMNHKGHGYIRPVVRLPEGAASLHLALMVGDRPRFDGRRFFLGESAVPFDRQQSILVNLRHRSVYMKSSYSLWPLLQRSERLIPSKGISEGDIVVILPKMFTGNTDFVDTPMGSMPGGFVLLSLIDSVLQKDWIEYIEYPFLWNLIMVIGGAWLGYRKSHLIFVLSMSSVVLATFGLAVSAFIFFNLYISWLVPLNAFLVTSIFWHAERNRQIERRAGIAEASLEGRLPPQLMQDIRLHPEQFTFAPVDRRVSVMFIDLVNFATATNKLEPREIFLQLREMIQLISHHVHDQGGIVDNVIGDGILCFFGYHYSMDIETSDHAEQAVRCAMAIQRDCVKRSLERSQDAFPILPTRIGINTTVVHFGDLGGTNSIRPTLVGSGVNLASRLESSCEPYRVLISDNSYEDLSAELTSELTFFQRFVSLKHYKGLYSAWELIPIERETLNRALDRFQDFRGMERFEERFALSFPEGCEAYIDGRKIQLVNISQRGLAFRSSRYLGREVIIQLDIRATSNRRWHDFLKDIPVRPIFIQIVWGMPKHENLFHHGARFINLPQAFRRDLIHLLQASQVNLVSEDGVS